METVREMELLREELSRLASETGIPMDWVPETTSTNDLARSGRYGDGSLVVAERQSAGRGQRGNSWSSTQGLNLTFSVVLCPERLLARDQFYLSKTAALAVADTLAQLGLCPAVKWPNDIYIGDRKTAGILIENDLAGDHVARSVVGIGLNVNQTEFDPALPNPTSLALACGGLLEREKVLRLFYRCLSERYGQMVPGAGFAALDNDYLRRLYRFGQEHRFADGRTGERFSGTICGVLPAGDLEVRHSDGLVRRYLFKEIEYLIGPGE